MLRAAKSVPRSPATADRLCLYPLATFFHRHHTVLRIHGDLGRAMVVRFFASIRNITGAKEIECGEPAPTLGDLLRLLSDRYGPEFRRWVLDGEELGGSVMVVVNGNDARHQAGLATQLVETDVISIMPIMAGGGNITSTQRSAISFQQEHEETWGPKGLRPAANGRVYIALLG